MRKGIILLFLIHLFPSVGGCVQQNKVSVGPNNEILYLEAATEAEARLLGTFLQEEIASE